jgi:hypothetical protein
VLPVAAFGAWGWFGVTGAVPVLIWWWQRRPRVTAAWWHIDIARVRAARLGPWRIWIAFHGAASLDIFSDEISRRDLALLRRTLKAQLAAGFSTSSRSENPGNRMVSSERSRVSG